MSPLFSFKALPFNPGLQHDILDEYNVGDGEPHEQVHTYVLVLEPRDGICKKTLEYLCGIEKKLKFFVNMIEYSETRGAERGFKGRTMIIRLNVCMCVTVIVRLLAKKLTSTCIPLHYLTY